MKFILKIVFTSATAYLMQLYMPWWSVVLASFMISLILSSKGLSSFFSGFLGIGALWFFLAWRIDSATGSILTEKVANLFSLPNSILLVLVTARQQGWVLQVIFKEYGEETLCLDAHPFNLVVAVQVFIEKSL